MQKKVRYQDNYSSLLYALKALAARVFAGIEAKLEWNLILIWTMEN